MAQVSYIDDRIRSRNPTPDNPDWQLDRLPMGRLVSVRQGCTIEVPDYLPAWERDRRIHDARLRDVAARCSDYVAVLQSAILLQGGSLKRSCDQAHIVTNWRRKTRRTTGPSLENLPQVERRLRLEQRPVVNHRFQVDGDEVAVIDGIRTTGIIPTMEHALRFLPPDEAFVAYESLLGLAAGRDKWWRYEGSSVQNVATDIAYELRERIEDKRGQRGVAQARTILAVASPFAESPWESELRRIALAAGYSSVEPQIMVGTRGGSKWVDLGERRMKRGIEINGDIKYEGEAGLARRGYEIERLELLRDAGWQIDEVSASSVADVRHVLGILDLRFAEVRDRAGLPQLWTPTERKIYGGAR